METTQKTISKVPLEVINPDGSKSENKYNVSLLSVDKTEFDAIQRKLDARSNLTEVENDYFATNNILPAPYDFFQLIMAEEQSNILRECIDAMVTNTVGFGHTFRLRKMTPEQKEKYSKEIEKEEAVLDSLFDFISPELPFNILQRQAKKTQELTGCLFIEVVRTDNKKTDQLNLCPVQRMRLIKQDKDFTPYTINVVDSQNDFKTTSIVRRKRFRRFVQLDAGGKILTYFKEFGDPRNISKITGEVLAKSSINDLATEIIYLPIFSPRTPYGIPRWISRIVAINGSRRAEEVNYFTLSQSHVPAMFVMVENGALSPGSIDRLRELIETQVSGNPNHGVVVLLEAEGVEYNFGIANTPQAKVKIQPVKEAQTEDQLYQEYDKNNRKRVRSSFRLSPVHTGDSDDYSHAAVKEARRVTDEQVFNPEREEWDNWINRILVDQGIRFLQYKSRTPNITDNEVLIKLLMAAEKSGGMTPFRTNTIMEDVFEGQLGPMPEGIDPHTPYSLQFAQAQNAQRPPGRPPGTGPNQMAAAEAKAAGEAPDDEEEGDVDENGEPIKRSISDQEFAEIFVDKILSNGL